MLLRSLILAMKFDYIIDDNDTSDKTAKTIHTGYEDGVMWNEDTLSCLTKKYSNLSDIDNEMLCKHDLKNVVANKNITCISSNLNNEVRNASLATYRAHCRLTP